jgi:predicted secreted hydrolase
VKAPRPARGLAALAGAALAWLVAAAAPADELGGRYVVYPAVVPGHSLEFPRDFGAHPDFRTEWWYVTGWLESGDGETLGFQLTFFRTRPDVPQDNPSAFAARQLIIAHAALSDPARGRLWHEQRIARASHGLAGATEGDTDVWLDRWRLRREGGGYVARVAGEQLSFDFTLQPTQAPMLNGDAGFSRKGREPGSASYYYSLPHLAVRGDVTRDGRRVTVTGSAWLDQEWSTALLDREATGWDWIGINLHDGGALMAFRLRDAAGGSHWAAGSWRRPDGTLATFGPGEIEFAAGRRWRSPRTGIEFPVEWRVRAGPLELDLLPLMDDQESDSRYTTGAVYWEGAVRARSGGRELGRGYLELTGYGEPLRLPGSDSP